MSLPSTLAPRIEAPATRSARPGVRIAIAVVLVVVVAVCFMTVGIRGSLEFALPRRATMLAAILVASFAQGVATVVFHTVTGNRILTPSIIGFDAMFELMQTLLAVAFGVAFLTATAGVPRLLLQTALMVGVVLLLYRWLLTGSGASVYLLLLVGVVLGMAFSSVSSFLQRLMAPTEYDLLLLELFGRLSKVDPDHLLLAIPLCAAAGAVVWVRRHRLDALLLGRDLATSVGVDHRREVTIGLVVVAVLIAFSTALVGPMTFFGFVIATIAYQVAGDWRHRATLPMAVCIGAAGLMLAQMAVQHLLAANGMVTVIIELVGGAIFLAVLLARRRTT